MSDPDRPLSEPQRIDLGGEDDPRDALYKAVARLAGGGVVGFPGDPSPLLAASALIPDAVASLLEASRGELPPTLAPNASEQIGDWVPGASEVARRLARKAWPGPVCLAFRTGFEGGLVRHLPTEVRSSVVGEGPLRLRLPSHPAIQGALRMLAGPLVLAEGPRKGFGPVDLVLEDGPPPPVPSPGDPEPTWTEVEFEGPFWRIARPGRLDHSAIAGLAGRIVLFVCTGNTCRSPMAEALCRRRLADRLGVELNALEAAGYRVISAGLAAEPGAGAASEAAKAVAALGATLESHRSRPLTTELIQAADFIVAMTGNHLDAILHHHPEAAGRARLLDPSGFDVDDPIGAGAEVYRETAAAIDRFLRDLLDTINP